MLNIKTIFIYKISEKIFFRADSQTTKGMFTANGPYFILDVSADVSTLGNQCLRTFKECKVGIPHPEDLTKLSVLEEADPYSTSDEAKLLKKLKRTQKDLRLSIKFDSDKYVFEPFRVINKQYSEGIKGASLTSDGNPENLGKALLQAFELCE